MVVIIRKVEIIISTMEIIHVGEGDDHNSIGEHHNERQSIIKWEVAFPDEGRGLSPCESACEKQYTITRAKEIIT